MCQYFDFSLTFLRTQGKSQRPVRARVRASNNEPKEMKKTYCISSALLLIIVTMFYLVFVRASSIKSTRRRSLYLLHISFAQLLYGSFFSLRYSLYFSYLSFVCAWFFLILSISFSSSHPSFSAECNCIF